VVVCSHLAELIIIIRFWKSVSITKHVTCRLGLKHGWWSCVNVEMLQLPDDAVRPPAVGSPVEVRWVDGKLYGAVFKGINNTSSVEVC